MGERYAWRARILPGKEAEYVRRHDEIWPELTAVLKEAGIVNYSIWRDGDGTLFGYYECLRGAEEAARVQAQSPVVAKWDAYMKDVMVMDPDPVTGAQPRLVQAFYME